MPTLIKTRKTPIPAVPRESRISSIVEECAKLIPPVWPLQDYVAVNPFLGMSDRNLMQANAALREVRNCDLFMPLEYYRAQFGHGAIRPEDIAKAFAECVSDHAHDFDGIELNDVVAALVDEEPGNRRHKHPQTVAEWLDESSGSGWSGHIVNDISRYCGMHFDRGQASWTSPWSNTSLFSAWQSAARHSWRMDWLGIKGFRQLVRGLPGSSNAAIAMLLDKLDVPDDTERTYLLRLLNSVSGWASYIVYQGWGRAPASPRNQDLAGLLAIRLAYDAALAKVTGTDVCRIAWSSTTSDAASERTSAAIRYALQVATEAAYRRRLCAVLTGGRTGATPERKLAQLVFCIDVRSEILRRHLEAESEQLETFGFAGFFGIPMAYRAWGVDSASAQCPVLLQPGVRVGETVRDMAEDAEELLTQRTDASQQQRTLWRDFQTSAVSCFSFVESMGPLSLGKLLMDASGQRKESRHAERLPRALAQRLTPAVSDAADDGFDFATRVQLAEGILRNLGLTQSFARLVVLCGHECEVVNNPYRAALDCGACGGHSGEPNARVAAMLLNDGDIRGELAARGASVPADTVFVAAVHNTTTDEVRVCDEDRIPPSHAADLRTLTAWLESAAAKARAERSARLGVKNGQALVRRAHDWSEVRPEWGLAGNAAFLIAPRERTRMLNLEGRCFLHSYDHRLDPEFRVLELIMTAPMVVTNWINLQYYASTVDNRSFGSGNKTIHNVVGQFGVLQGNGGDLMTGLPWQCVHDGQRYQHEPLRLLVMIAAPRAAVASILQKHASIRQLATNRWLQIVAWDDDGFYRWTGRSDWERLPEALAADFAETDV